MPSLGERLVVPYGWEACLCHHTDEGNLHPHFDAPCPEWTEKDGSQHHTPDPENSWQDFGAMLEWAENRSVEWRWYNGTVRVENRRGNRVAWHENIYTLEQFRRAVTEKILEALDA